MLGEVERYGAERRLPNVRLDDEAIALLPISVLSWGSRDTVKREP
jgi:hypothetical protein